MAIRFIILFLFFILKENVNKKVRPLGKSCLKVKGNLVLNRNKRPTKKMRRLSYFLPVPKVEKFGKVFFFRVLCGKKILSNF